MEGLDRRGPRHGEAGTWRFSGWTTCSSWSRTSRLPGHVVVDGIDDVVARLRGHGAELVGGIARYEDAYRLCYVRGPEGIIIGLAEPLG